MSKFYEKQIWHLLGAIALIFVAKIAADVPEMLSGSLWGIQTPFWYWGGIYLAIVHQLFVMLVWRSQLHFEWITNRFGDKGFIYYSRGFALISFLRLFFVLALSIANRGTLIGNRSLFNILGVSFSILVIWLMYSVIRYFSIHRALGADHFEKRFRKMGLVKGGIFNYIRNGMYIVGLLMLWVPGLFLASKGGLIIGLMGHAYIWVHYFTTEKPDMLRIYGPSARCNPENFYILITSSLQPDCADYLSCVQTYNVHRRYAMSKKKMWTAGLIALVLLLGAAGTTMAYSGDAAPSFAPPSPGRGHRPPHGGGEVSAVGDDEFTILKGDDVEITVIVDEETRYFGDLESFDDIEIGLKVAVMGKREGDQSVLAKMVGSGDEFPLGQRAGGEVTAVDSDSLTIENREGESLTFQVDDETLFLSRDDEVQSLSDIEVGDHVSLHYEEASDGSLLAKSIGSGSPKGDCDQRSGQGSGEPKGDGDHQKGPRQGAGPKGNRGR